MSTPAGLLVPIIRNVETLSIAEIAAEIDRLAGLGREGKLAASDLAVSSNSKSTSNGGGAGIPPINTGPTFTISNIGSIAAGAGVVAPVIVPPQVAILALGRAKVVPAFADEDAATADAIATADAGAWAGAGTGTVAQSLRVIAREECTFSWSADHRVLDGATVARCAEMVRELVEGGGEEMLLGLR